MHIIYIYVCVYNLMSHRLLDGRGSCKSLCGQIMKSKEKLEIMCPRNVSLCHPDRLLT